MATKHESLIYGKICAMEKRNRGKMAKETAKMKMKVMIGGLLAGAAVKAAVAATVTLAPGDGVVTNVMQFFAGDTAVEIVGPGTVALNPANAHTGGTTLSGGTLLLNGTFDGVSSPVGVGTFTVAGGTLSGSGTFPRDITGTGAATIEAPGGGGWAWTGNNAFSAAMTVTNGTLEIADGETSFGGDLTVADGASVSVTGGTLGLSSASGAGTGAIVINGGTLKNVSTVSGSDNVNYFEWLAGSVSVSIGAEGAVFKDGGTTAFYAQFKTPLASSVEQGQPAAGVTFDGGNWGLYAAMAYDGPTILKNGAKLFFANAGTLPPSSAVTVGSGSELRNGNTNKDISSLTIEEGGIIGVNNAKQFTVTGSVVLPKSAKVAIYNGNFPYSGGLTKSGTYDVLRVPVSYADALRSVIWSYANAANTWSHTFSVSTDSTYATLSVTVAVPAAAGADIAVAAGETLAVTGAVSVGSGSITVNGTMIVPGTLDGTAADGTVTVNDGGVLDVTGNIRPSSVADGRFDLYVNEGGTLRARQINVNETFEATAASSIHFDGATVYPIAAASGDDYRYFPRYATAYIGAKGVTFDLSDWDADGRTGWYRFSCMGLLNSDPALNGASDGGITVRGKPDGTAIFYFGTGLNGATLNGGVTVEAGGKISAGDAALADDSVRLLPGSMFKSYNTSFVVAVQSLTVGAANGTEPVALQTGTFATGPALKVEDLSVLSPVEFLTAGYTTSTSVWRQENAAAHPGVYTALVYRTVSPALDTSLFRLPAEYADDYSLSVETVALTEGDYTGYTAVVMTVAEAAHGNLELKSGATETQTLSADAVYGNIYIGDFNEVGNPVLTVDGGDIKADTLHLIYQPADGANASTGKHTASYVQNGGTVSVGTIYSAYRGSNDQAGRAYAAITVNGGTLACTGDALLGYNRTRSGYTTTLTVNEGGTVAIGGKLTLIYYNNNATSDSYSAPQGVILMNGGTLDVAGDIDLSRRKNYSGYAVDGGIFLRGGVLSARNIIQTIAETPVQRLVFDGGVYAPNAAGRTMSGLTTAHVSTNGAIVSTEKLPAGATYTIAQNLLTDPGLNGAADGGFTKRGAGTLALSGSNTFIGPTVVEAGTLAVSSADAISDDVTVSAGAALDLGGSSVTLGRIAASGVIVNGSLSVTGSVAAAESSLLNVAGDLALVPGLVVDFAGGNVAGWRPLAAVSGTVAVPAMLKARNAGDFNRCKTSVIDGVVYVCPTSAGFMFSVR